MAITVERLILNTPLSDAEQQGLIREWTHATDERKTEIEDYCVQQIASWWRESWKKDEEWGRDPFAESTKRYDILLKLLTDNNPTADDEATLMWICRQAWVNQ